MDGDFGNVFISGYDENMDQNELKNIVQKMCNVPCAFLTHKGTYAFYKFRGAHLTEEIMTKLHGQSLPDGRQLACQSVKKKNNKSSRVDKLSLSRVLCKLGKEFGYVVTENEMFLMERCARSLHVSDLPQHLNEQQLSKGFEEFGEVEESTLVRDRGHTVHKGYGFVVFMYHGAMEKFKRRSRQPVYIETHAIRIQSAKLAKQVLSNAQAIGFFGADASITPMFSELIKAGVADVKKDGPGGPMNKNSLSRPSYIYMKDTMSGQIFAFTQQELSQYVTTSQAMMAQQRQQMMRPAPHMVQRMAPVSRPHYQQPTQQAPKATVIRSTAQTHQPIRTNSTTVPPAVNSRMTPAAPPSHGAAPPSHGAAPPSRGPSHVHPSRLAQMKPGSKQGITTGAPAHARKSRFNPY